MDLYNFTQSSLKDACKNYGLGQENSKKDFYHEKINNWNDVYEHRNEISEYLKMYVVSMKKLYKKFNDMIYEKLEVNITEYLTLPD